MPNDEVMVTLVQRQDTGTVTPVWPGPEYTWETPGQWIYVDDEYVDALLSLSGTTSKIVTLDEAEKEEANVPESLKELYGLAVPEPQVFEAKFDNLDDFAQNTEDVIIHDPAVIEANSNVKQEISTPIYDDVDPEVINVSAIEVTVPEQVIALDPMVINVDLPQTIEQAPTYIEPDVSEKFFPYADEEETKE